MGVEIAKSCSFLGTAAPQIRRLHHASIFSRNLLNANRFPLPFQPARLLSTSILRAAKRDPKIMPPKKALGAGIESRKAVEAQPSQNSPDPTGGLDMRHILARNPMVNADYLNTTLNRPLVIYKAPSHGLLYMTSIAASSVFFGYTYAVAAPVVFYPPADVWWVLPPVFALCGGLLVAMGIFFLGTIHKVVKRVTVVPRPGSSLLAEVEIARLGPFGRHSITVPLTSLRIGQPLTATVPHAPSRLDPADVPWFGRPFVWIMEGMKSLFRETRVVLMRDVLVLFLIPGHGVYKLDARGSAIGGAAGLDVLINLDYSMSQFGSRSASR